MSYKVLDVNTYLGHWPFHPLPVKDAVGLLPAMDKAGVSASVVTPINSIFYKDCLAGFRETVSQIGESSRLFPLAVVNPDFPGWEDDLISMIDVGAVGIRLFPNYHAYSLLSEEVAHLINISSQASLPVVITFRVQDERSHHWLAKVPPLDSKSVSRAISNGKGARFILSSATWGELEALADIIDDSETLIEISHLKGPIFAVEKLCERFGTDRIIYGSGFPMWYFESTLLRVTMAEIPDCQKRKILYENAACAFNLEGENT